MVGRPSHPTLKVWDGGRARAYDGPIGEAVLLVLLSSNDGTTLGNGTRPPPEGGRFAPIRWAYAMLPVPACVHHWHHDHNDC
jgi:hypothetical protein